MRASLATSAEIIISPLHRHGQPRQLGRAGSGLFINRSEALRFAMLENGRRPRAVIMVPGILEFSIGGPAKAVAKDSTGVVEAKAQPTAEFGPHDLVASKPRERGFVVVAHR